ncbi:MAG TPA: PDZ domain-containing protein, partial [Minicystis sp.]|nr:PDZ domain-containing protein [Minicystis sp.]
STAEPDRPRKGVLAFVVLARRLRAGAVCLALALAGALGPASLGCSTTVGSIGAVLGRDNQTGALYVRDAPHGLAADRAGLRPGDQVLMIDGVYAASLDAKEVRARLRGDVGASVELTVVRDGVVRRVKVARTPLAPKRPPAAAPAREAPLD